MKKLLSALLIFYFESVLGEASCPPDQNGNIFETKKLPGGCPKISYIANLNTSRITGGFYRTFSTSIGLKAGCEGCITAYVAQLDEDTYRLTSCCRKGCGIKCSSDVGGLVFRLVDSVFIMERSGIEVFVLDYDENYYVLYSCIAPYEGQIKEAVYVRTNYPTVSLPLKNRIFQTIRGNGIEVEQIFNVLHENSCSYSF